MVVPRHDGGGFAALPDTVARLLGVGEGGVALDVLPARAQRVVLVLLDAFGWRFFTRHGDHPLLQRFDAVVPLTTQFPSTTTAHVTTLHTGVPLGEHGLYEWNVYEPSLDALITPLLFCYAGDGARDTLLRAGTDPGFLRSPAPTLYERLAQAGVACHVFAPASFAPSTYDGVLARAARDPSDRHPVGGTDRAGAPRWARRPGRRTRTSTGTRSTPPVTSTARRRRSSPPRPNAASTRWTPGCARCPRGRSSCWPPTTGRSTSTRRGRSTSTRQWPQIVDLLARGRDERLLVPAGSARDLFLHCRPEAVDEVIDGLGRLLGERATVHRVADLVAAGWLGTVGERLRARLADVCVLPAPGETVWWRERHRFDMRFRGHHGGLSEDEARTQVAALVV